ncbi:MAG: tetratricopeptide repeat protein [Proteobacteria bacterium]|nr:tetratricopeptide repeat protein [Pseudomonadota bacterium]MBU4384534.1 tetratricopeptide repeat protein [Pseudomonadota bacterium]MBU4605514.1 tetratricopeptide repeat protein [Pseudomonadota bacterium]MCG2766318.1 tetratricopeptide repeat protein [Desulfarculaceae bacterium]
MPSMAARSFMIALLSVFTLAAVALAGGKDDIMAGNLAAQAGQFKKAEALYSKAIASKQLTPANLAVAYNNRGSARDDLGRTKAALADYNQAILTDPSYAEAYYNRSYAFEKMKLWPRALADAIRAAELQPNDETYLQREHYLRSKAKGK